MFDDSKWNNIESTNFYEWFDKYDSPNYKKIMFKLQAYEGATIQLHQSLINIACSSNIEHAKWNKKKTKRQEMKDKELQNQWERKVKQFDDILIIKWFGSPSFKFELSNNFIVGRKNRF